MLYFLLASSVIATTNPVQGYEPQHAACVSLKASLCTDAACIGIDQTATQWVLNTLSAATQSNVSSLPAGMTATTGPLFAMYGFMATMNLTHTPRAGSPGAWTADAQPGLPAIWPTLNAIYDCDNNIAAGDAATWNQYAAPWATVSNCFVDTACQAAMGTIYTKAVAKGVPYDSWALLNGTVLPQLSPQLTNKQACDLFFVAMEVENAKAISVLSTIVAVGMVGGDSIINHCNTQLEDEIKKQVFMLLMIVGAVALVVGAIFASLGCCCFNRMSKKSGIASQV